MCGLRRKIRYPDFTELVSQFDIFCVSKTKLDDYDFINIDGYDFSRNAENKSIYASVVV